MTADLDPQARKRLTRALWLARAVMLWEQGAGIWMPLLIGAGAVAVAGLWGAFDPLSDIADGLVVAFVLVFALSLGAAAAARLRWPRREEVRRRIELDAGLVHTPLSTLDDQPATGDPALWALHRARALEGARNARIGRPRASLAAADPFALRYVLVVAAALALWSRGLDRAPEAVMAFHPVGQAADATGQAAVYLGDQAGAMVEEVLAQLAPAPQLPPQGRPRASIK